MARHPVADELKERASKFSICCFTPGYSPHADKRPDRFYHNAGI